MNLFKAVLDTRNHNGVVGKITQFDTATLEFQIVTDGQINEAWESPTFELIAMKRDEKPVRETEQDRFTILSKEEHKVRIDLKEQFLACRGSVKMQLIVKDGDRLSTSVFYIVVGESLDHGIVESHRDVAVLDELEKYVKTGYDALGYQEQRMKDVEKATHELNELMKENELQRQEAESERQSLFEENEIQRQGAFSQQLTSQRHAFDNSQSEREGAFDDLKRSMSSNFTVAQNEREYEFDNMMSSNQTQFNSAESSRANTFSNSQIENERVFTANENARQTLFNTNEAARKTNETTRVANENTRKTNESSRVTAEAERQKKMSAFEAKATQLSNELDAQVERVDTFVSANEEKLLGDRDKVDYMGNVHESVKAASDANVDWLLGEVNTAHYEGQHITATDTIEGRAKSAILKGNTLVNLITNSSSNEIINTKKQSDGFIVETLNNESKINYLMPTFELSTQYTLVFNSSHDFKLYIGFDSFVSDNWRSFDVKKGTNKITLNSLSTNPYPNRNLLFRLIPTELIEITELMLLKGDYTNIDIPYFEGMQSVKMPVLTTTGGKNLFDGEFKVSTYLSGKPYFKNNSMSNVSFPYTTSANSRGIASLVKVKPSTRYSVSISNEPENSVLVGAGYENVDSISNALNAVMSVGTVENETSTTISFTTTSNCNYMVIGCFIKYEYEQAGGVLTFNKAPNIQLEESSTATPYEPYKSNILTVNEEVELRRIGDVKDELDLTTGKLTQRIGEIVLNGSEDWKGLASGRYYLNNILNNVNRPGQTKINLKCDKLKPISYNDEYYGALGISLFDQTNYDFIIRTDIQTLKEFKQWLSNNPTTVQYQLATESVKTVDLSGDAVYSYNEVTHYDCSGEEGSLVPTLSVDVPTNLPALVSRQRATIETQKAQIQTLEIENEQLIEQNQVQDEDIALNQDAINFMLFASEMLADDNKTKGVNTMAAYLANQILKGKLDYSLVVSRYPQFKEDIDTILILEGEENLIK